MVDNFYQNKIQPTINKTKDIFEESGALPLALLISLIGAIVVMIILNSEYPIFNPDITLDVFVIGNALIGFLFFSLFFTIITSIVVACIFSIIIAPPTKKQLILIKDACVDYARIFRELRVQRYELDEDRLIKLFDSSLERMLKKYGIKSLKELGIFLTKAHNLIESQNDIIAKQSDEIKDLKTDQRKTDKRVNRFLEQLSNTKNNDNNIKPINKSTKFQEQD